MNIASIPLKMISMSSRSWFGGHIILQLFALVKLFSPFKTDNVLEKIAKAQGANSYRELLYSNIPTTHSSVMNGEFIGSGYFGFSFHFAFVTGFFFPAFLEFATSKPAMFYLIEVSSSAFIALAWALHPVNLTSVLYSIQRMNSMSAMFVFAGILVYISGRRDIDFKPVTGWIKIFSSVIIFTPLAWFSKENGALLPLFLFIIEITILGFTTNSEKNKKLLYIF